MKKIAISVLATLLCVSVSANAYLTYRVVSDNQAVYGAKVLHESMSTPKATTQEIAQFLAYNYPMQNFDSRKFRRYFKSVSPKADSRLEARQVLANLNWEHPNLRKFYEETTYDSYVNGIETRPEPNGNQVLYLKAEVHNTNEEENRHALGVLPLGVVLRELPSGWELVDIIEGDDDDIFLNEGIANVNNLPPDKPLDFSQRLAEAKEERKKSSS